MNCPRPETLSRWVDGTLSSRDDQGVRIHVDRCARCRAKVEDLRSAVAWLGSVSGEGEKCLSIEGMAAVLEGRAESDHVETCPRCAAEFSALKAATRSATTRIYRRRVPRMAWGVAASLVAAAGILLLVLPAAPPPEPEPEPAPKIVRDPVPRPAPPAVVKSDIPPAGVRPPVSVTPKPALPLAREPERFERKPRPAPPPPVPPPTPEPPVVRKPAPPARMPETRSVEPAPVALEVRSGSLSAMTDGRWSPTKVALEGRLLRANGRTRLEFARSRVILEGSSKFTLTRNELSLMEGRMSAEVRAGSPFALLLEDHRIVPQASISRVLFSARPDRIVVEEGAATANEIVLHEGREHHIRKGRLVESSRRTLAPLARSREIGVWRLDLDRVRPEDRSITAGSIQRHPEGTVLQSGAPAVSRPGTVQVAYLAPDPAEGFVTVGERTAIRFRYFLSEPGRLHFVMWNNTKGENFERWIDAVPRRWTTVTLFFRDIPANPGGKKVVCEAGDRYRSITWSAPTSGDPTKLFVKGVEVVEIGP